MSSKDVERGYGFALGVLKALFIVFIVFPFAIGLVFAIISEIM